MKKVSFVLLEESICKFIAQLENYSSSLVKEIRYYLSEAEKEEHALKISRYINSSELATVIQLQQKKLPQYHQELTIECGDEIPVLFCPDVDLRMLHENLYQWLKDTLQRYYEYLVGACPMEYNTFLHEF